MKRIKKLFSVCAFCLTIALCAGLFVGCGTEPVELSSNHITLEYTAVEFDGTEKKPTVKVTIDEEEISADEYTVEYSKNINVGTASVKVVAAEDSKVISGSVNVGFEITQAVTTASTLNEIEAGLTSANFSGVSLTQNVTIASDKIITIPEGKTLTIGDKVLTNEGTLVNNGTINTNTLIEGAGTFTNEGEYVVNVDSFDELVAATGKATTVVLASDIAEDDGATKYSIDNRTSNEDLKIVVDLNGKKLQKRLAVYYDKDANINVVVKNGTIIAPASDAWGVTVIGNADNDADAIVTIENVVAVGADCGISTNGLYAKGTIVAKNSVFGTKDSNAYSFVSETGGYFPALYKYRFENTTFVGKTGYYTKSGDHKIINCQINGVKEEYTSPAYNGSGCEDTGSALIVDSSQGYKSPVNVEVNGGTLTSAKGFAIEEVITYKTEAIESYSEVVVKNNPTMISGTGKDAIAPLYVMIKFDASLVTDVETKLDNIKDLAEGEVAEGTYSLDEFQEEIGSQAEIPFYVYVGDILNDVDIHTFSCGGEEYSINDLTNFDAGNGVIIADSVFFVDGNGKVWVAASTLNSEMQSGAPEAIYVNGKAFPLA